MKQMKLFDPNTWPKNPTDADRKQLWDMYANHQKFKLKVLLVLVAVLAARWWM